MNDRKRHYWAMRTDKENKELLFQELKSGRVRQGWGYDDSQNLEMIQGEILNGGKWWERLTDKQREALPNFRMLGEGNDSVKIGDILLLPNLPEQDFFCLAEVIGRYYFKKLPLDSVTDVNRLGEDYGHVLPVKLITPMGINKYNELVFSGIRATLRTLMRMWNLGGYSSEIESLLTFSLEGKDLTSPSSGSARLDNAWSNAINKAKEALQDHLFGQLRISFQAAEWEEPIRTALEKLYTKIDVIKSSGPTEYGADIVIEIPNYFGDRMPWLIVIQVKNYTGEIGPRDLSQIEESYFHYSKDGKILAGILMTTADGETADFTEEKSKLEQKLGIPIKLVLRKELTKIIAEGLSVQIV